MHWCNRANARLQPVCLNWCHRREDFRMAHVIPIAARPMATQRTLRRFNLTSGSIDLRLETDLWSALSGIASDRRMPLANLIDLIDQQRGTQSLTRALWRFAIAYFQALCDTVEPMPFARPALKPVC